MSKLTEEDRKQREHSLNKLDWLAKLAAANTRYMQQGARLKTDGCDPNAEIHLSAADLRFLVEAGRLALAEQEGRGNG